MKSPDSERGHYRPDNSRVSPANTDYQACPCGRPARYDLCCGRYHANLNELPCPDAESLMRSRYSAYVLNQLDYLLATWHASTRPATLSPNEPGLRWLGLEVKSHRPLDADHAEVSFVARSKLGGRAHRLQETSRFVHEQGRWFYVDGDLR